MAGQKLDRPVKWVEDRHEHILNAAHSRDNIYDVEIGFDDDGKNLAVTSSFLVDSGAYTRSGPVSQGIPSPTCLAPTTSLTTKQTARSC